MKTIFRVSVFGLVAAAFMAVSALSTFAQNPCDDTLEVKQVNYTIFRDGRKEMSSKTPSIAKAKAGIKGGEDFLAKYAACPDDKPVSDFITAKLPELKTWVEKKEMYDTFNTAIKDPATVNPSAAFSSGKQIIGKDPDSSLDVSLVLATIGYDNAVKNPPVSTFDNDAITFAKSAIQQIEGGKTSTTWGFYKYNYAILDAQKKVDPVKSKANALAYMNYTIATIMYYGQKMQKDALPYFYKVSQSTSDVKNKPGIYQAIGAWYLDELLKIDKDRLAKITANENKDNEETLGMLALEKGYADRAIDAYARAYKLAPTTDAAYRTSLNDKLKALYKIRFDKIDGIDTYVSTVMNKPMPDPATPVEPIKEETPATTTSTSSTTTTPSTTPSSTTTTKPTTTPSNTTTKPADTTTKPATDTTKPTTTVKPATTTKPSTSKTTTKTKATTKKKG